MSTVIVGALLCLALVVLLLLFCAAVWRCKDLQHVMAAETERADYWRGEVKAEFERADKLRKDVTRILEDMARHCTTQCGSRPTRESDTVQQWPELDEHGNSAPMPLHTIDTGALR
jgi:hypothetical protein